MRFSGIVEHITPPLGIGDYLVWWLLVIGAVSLAGPGIVLAQHARKRAIGLSAGESVWCILAGFNSLFFAVAMISGPHTGLGTAGLLLCLVLAPTAALVSVIYGIVGDFVESHPHRWTHRFGVILAMIEFSIIVWSLIVAFT